MADHDMFFIFFLILIYFATWSNAQLRNRNRFHDDLFNDHVTPSNTHARQNVNPCHPNYHRVIENEPRRSYNYRFGSGSNRELAICDRDLVAGWYRFQSLAGNTIPTSCPGVNYCGTRAPVWMKGSIPNVEDGMVKATGCISVKGNCCTTQLPMFVRNCSDFVVYHLQPTPACPSAFCAGYEVPCPNGLTSENGYTPCHFPVDILETKVSYGLSKDGSQIQFFCDVTLGGHVVPETVALQVDWLADEEIIQSETFGLLQQHKGLLKEDKWAVGQTLQCRAKAKHTVINTFTAPSTSPPLNTGVVLLSPTNTIAVEGSEPVNVEFQTTIPIVCPKKEKKKQEKKQEKKEEEEEEECCVTFDISTKIASQSGPRCAGGNPFDLIVMNTCQYKVCADEWNATHKLPIWAVNDGFFGGEDGAESPSSVIVEIQTTETSPPRWQDIILPTQEISVQQADVSEECIVSDYIQTFDGVRFQNTYEGTFVLYKHSGFPYEIQIHRRKCTNLPLCTCAIAMRFGEIMLAADVCSTGRMRFWSYTLDGNYIEPNKLHHLPKIIRIDEGRSFQIQFPTGTRLNLGPNLRYITIQASQSDMEQTTGLCGSFDRDPSNDFSSFKGQVVCTPNPNTTITTCDDFTKAWRLLTEQSLFVGSFTTDGNDEDETHLDDYYSPGHCSCSGLKADDETQLRPKATKSSYHQSPYENYQPEEEQNENESEANKCSSSQCVDPRGEDVTNQFLELLQDEDFVYEGEEFGIKSSEAPLLPIFHGQYSLKLSLESNGQITEDSAEVYCRGLIEGMPVTKLCRDVAQVDVEAHILYCRNEVMHSKSTVWTSDVLEHLRWNCRYQVYHNLSTWEPQLGRQHGTPPLSILSSLCLNNCSNVGTCDHGICRCSDGYSGADCSVNTKTAPKVLAMGFVDACDVRGRACSEVLVWGDRFADSDKIKCHFEIYRAPNVKAVPALSGSVIGNGRLLTFQSIVCDIPDMPIHDAKVANFYIPGEGLEKTRQLLRVRLSYGFDGTKSEPVDYVIFDSLCWECSSALACQPRVTQSCNVLSDPYGSNNDPFQNSPSFSSPSVGFAQSNSPLQYSPDSSSDFSPASLPFAPPIPAISKNHRQPSLGQLHPALSSPCRFPKDSGPCRNDNLRYFFDTVSAKCRPFIFGGCQGNSNNFVSEQDCLQSCASGNDAGRSKDFVDNITLPKPESASSILSLGQGFQGLPLSSPSSFNVGQLNEKCNAGSSTGSCHDEIVRYYYDSVMRKCRPFITCPGSKDNFPSKESCMRVCERTLPSP